MVNNADEVEIEARQRQTGFINLPDFSGVAAITFCDVVVSCETLTDNLPFHELVHVEQYRQLGLSGFSASFVRGFLEGARYDAIPLEANAFQLSDRFRRDPDCRFDVASEIKKWIIPGRF